MNVTWLGLSSLLQIHVQDADASLEIALSVSQVSFALVSNPSEKVKLAKHGSIRYKEL